MKQKLDENDKEDMELAPPQKKYFRQRAHSNPLSDHFFLYPTEPSKMNWHPFYPAYFNEDGSSNQPYANSHPRVEVVDVGCSYGGMSIALSPVLKDMLILGIE